MSDSEDDKPLAARNIAVKPPAAAPKSSNAAASSKPRDVTASNPPDAIRLKAAQKAPVIDTSDSEDDKVLGTRAKPAARPGSGGAVKRNPSNADTKPKTKLIPIKKEVKDEPLSPKSEPEDLPQQGKKPRAKKGEGEKRVVVKKEYEKPGQTRETPSEIDPLRRFYSTLREQRPDSEMAKKWCLVHGILDDEEAEQIAVELKLKKGQLRSPSRPTPQKRKAPAAATRKPTATSAATKSKVKQESSSEDSDGHEFIAPTRKVQKQGSGTTAGGSSRPKAANGQLNNKGAGESAAAAQPARAQRPASGSNRPSSREGSQAAGPSRPASGGANRSGGGSKPTSGGAGTAAGDRPTAKPSRPLVASTTKDKAFADGGLDPISDSEDEMPLARRRFQRD